MPGAPGQRRPSWLVEMVFGAVGTRVGSLSAVWLPGGGVVLVQSAPETSFRPWDISASSDQLTPCAATVVLWFALSQRSRPQPVNQAQNLCEQSSGDSDFRELKGDITAMSHDLRADRDELVAQGGQ